MTEKFLLPEHALSIKVTVSLCCTRSAIMTQLYLHLPIKGEHSIMAMAVIIPEASGMNMMALKTSGKKIGIGMRMRTKHGMNGTMIEL